MEFVAQVDVSETVFPEDFRLHVQLFVKSWENRGTEHLGMRLKGGRIRWVDKS